MDRRQAIRAGIIGLGGITTVSSLQLLVSCSKENIASAHLLNSNQIKLTDILVDIIIPETATSSASQAGVVQFIDIALNECFVTEDQKLFTDGLGELVESSFDSMKSQEQIEILNSLEAQQSPFFTLLKRLTLIGYFTSELGIKENYNYAPVPGKYQGCIPFDVSDKPWRGNNL